jgi:hypothetical protein
MNQWGGGRSPRRSVFRGFVIGTVIETSAVYAPGGKTCLVDDFRDDPQRLGRDWRGFVV